MTSGVIDRRRHQRTQQDYTMLHVAEKAFLLLILLVLAIVCFMTLVLLPEREEFHNTENVTKHSQRRELVSLREIQSGLDVSLERRGQFVNNLDSSHELGTLGNSEERSQELSNHFSIDSYETKKYNQLMMRDALAESTNDVLKRKVKIQTQVHDVPTRYTSPPQSGVHATGMAIDVDDDLLRTLQIPPQVFKTLSAKSVHRFVIATGSSSNHFNESKDAVRNVQQYFGGYPIYYYDLGLEEDERKQILSWCNVTLRKFPFHKFPPHVVNLTTYAFKPMIIQEILKEYDGVFWMDSSVRIQNPDWTSIYAKVLNNGGVFMLNNHNYTNHVVTHPRMYEYFPTDIKKQQFEKYSFGEGNSLLIHNTKDVYWNILHWWYLCALDEECIAPTREINCYDLLENENDGLWAYCHRFDQSLLNILVPNFYGYKPEKYTSPASEPTNPVTILRDVVSGLSPIQCHPETHDFFQWLTS